ncbi:MAG: hypothetical protein E6G74_20115 [Alphaproteobacteria bacterium]|nr:MAG: hypothetical protein E6G74_20115 [Alphaproteobacteria bacterium]
MSKELITDAKSDPPNNEREFAVLTKALYAEIRNKLLVVVPPHRRKFYNAREFIGTSIQAAFPSSFAELRLGGQCLAIGQFTACAFHSLRAVEIGLRTMAAKLGVYLPFPLVQADWETLIRGIESKVQAMKDLKKGEEKDEMLNFYSNACMPFRYFKDGSRLRIFHARELYDEPRAISLFQHSRDFFETLSTKMKEDDA